MIIFETASVENIHRIQRKPPMSGPDLLEHQHLIRDHGGGPNYTVTEQEPETYETTPRSTQTLGPVEKKPMGGQQDKSRDYIFQKDQEKDLGKKRKHDNPEYVRGIAPKVVRRKPRLLNRVKKSSFNKSAQVTQDIVSIVAPSFANVTAILGNEQSDGSGFFISKNHLVTAAHVVFLTTDNNKNKQIIESVQVGINVAGQMFQSYIVDYNVLNDFVTIFIDSVKLGIVNYIKPINLGNSSNVKVGEQVVLIGNPISNSVGAPTVTHGIVSTGSGVAQKGMFVVDAEALEGMSGGMCYSIDRKAVIGIISGYFSNNQSTGGATTLTICAGIDAVKNSAKKKHIPFIFKEAFFKSRIISKSNNRGSVMKDDDVAHQQNESVGVTGGPGKGRYGKNPRKNFEQSVTQGPGNKSIPVGTQYPTLHGRELYMDNTSTRSMQSTPLDQADEDLKKTPRIKTRMDQMDESKGEWMFNIPLGYGHDSENSIVVFRNEQDFYAYYEDKKIAESKFSDKNKKPLLTLMRDIHSKYGFDESYQKYIEDYGLGILQ